MEAGSRCPEADSWRLEAGGRWLEAGDGGRVEGVVAEGGWLEDSGWWPEAEGWGGWRLVARVWRLEAHVGASKQWCAEWVECETSLAMEVSFYKHT